MTQTTKSYDTVIIKKLDKSRIEVSGSIAAEVWGAFRPQALKYINDSVTIAGFRKGMVPENVLVSKVGEAAIMEEMSELALSKAYLDIIIDNKIDAIGRPQVRVTKLASGNPLEFTAMTAVVPEITLPDYKKLASSEIKKSNPADLKVTEKDLEDAMLRVRKAHAEHRGSDLSHPHNDGHGHTQALETDRGQTSDVPLPELTDEFVRTLGDFNDLPDFKNKLSDLTAEQKADEYREKLRVRIATAISDATTVELPDIMIESELDRTQSQFDADIERMGVKLDAYLKHANKTLADIRLEWRPHAEKKAKLQLILNQIAKEEKIQPNKEEIETEVDHIVEHYKDADRDSVAVYAETVLTNEKVFKFLEGK